MSLVLNHFGGHILKRSTKRISLLAVVRLDTPPEIAYFDYVSFFYKYVFGLDISVNESLFVHVVYSRAYLDEEVKGCVFTQRLFFSDQEKQIWLACILQSKIDHFFVIKTRE